MKTKNRKIKQCKHMYAHSYSSFEGTGIYCACGCFKRILKEEFEEGFRAGVERGIVKNFLETDKKVGI
jgi:hypothetical protein